MHSRSFKGLGHFFLRAVLNVLGSLQVICVCLVARRISEQNEPGPKVSGGGFSGEIELQD